MKLEKRIEKLLEKMRLESIMSDEFTKTEEEFFSVMGEYKEKMNLGQRVFYDQYLDRYINILYQEE